MTRPRVFVTRRIPDVGLRLLQAACEVDVWEGELPPPRATLLQRARGAEGLLTLLTDRIDAEVMEAAGPQLRVISNYAVGYDNVDVAAATARGIAVGNTPDVLTAATADFTFALLLAAARRVVEGDRFTRAGRWQTWGPLLLLGQGVAGATLGIIGLGRIGQAVARRATGFAMEVLYHHPDCGQAATTGPGPRCVDLDTLLRQADFITLHTPLTPATRHLINADALARVKPTAILINTARGGVVDQEALYEALAGGRLAYAALDVTDPEPIPPDHPLLSLGNILITPHMASATVGARAEMARLAAENLLAGLRGERLRHGVNVGEEGAEDTKKGR